MHLIITRLWWIWGGQESSEYACRTLWKVYEVDLWWSLFEK